MRGVGVVFWSGLPAGPVLWAVVPFSEELPAASQSQGQALSEHMAAASAFFIAAHACGHIHVCCVDVWQLQACAYVVVGVLLFEPVQH
jgi:hypothetical protein